MLQLCTTLQHGVHARSVTGPAHLGLCIHVGTTLQQQPSALQVAHGQVQRRTDTLRVSQARSTGRQGIRVDRSPCTKAGRATRV